MLKPSQLSERQLLSQGPGTLVYSTSSPEYEALILKIFTWKDATNWKALELFEREAQVLQQLDHPRLPRLLAYGVEEDAPYLIYPLITGESLKQKLDRGWRPSLDDVLSLVKQLLDILVWLHQHHPPLIHRDIKPSNLILNGSELFLIDFGSVVQYLKPQGGSTVAGTFGYMAPEQLSGRALPCSDLYALGACVIHLLSGISPGELPQERLRIRFEEHVQLAEPLANWLRSLIQPHPEERCPDAASALRTLEQALNAPTALAQARPQAQLTSLVDIPPPPKPVSQKHQMIEFSQFKGGISIQIPQREVHYPIQNLAAIALAYFAGVKLLELNSHFLLTLTQLPFFPLLVLGLLVVSLAVSFDRNQKDSTAYQMMLNQTSLSIQHGKKELEIPWSHLQSIQLRRRRPGLTLRYIDARHGRVRKLKIRQSLESQESNWLLGTLMAYMKQNKQLSGP